MPSSTSSVDVSRAVLSALIFAIGCALTLKRPDLGLIQTGYTADLIIVNGNPLDNLRYLYAFGSLDMVDGEIVRRGGVRWTIKDGVVFDNAALIQEVVEMVSESKRGWVNPVPKLFAPMFGQPRP